MKHFDIQKPDTKIIPLLQDKIDNLTKPKGSLGMLEEMALHIGWIQQTLSPQLLHPAHIIFAGDHGIAAEGVSISPQEVTFQMVDNFLKGGAGINFLARQHRFDLQIVDAGVNRDFDPDLPIQHRKIRKGTRNFLHESAMTREELLLSIEHGAACTEAFADTGCNVIAFGEMGIANTSASSLWMTCLTDIPLKQCVGAGCDNSGHIVEHKYRVLKEALESYHGDNSAEQIMQYFGGYEMTMTVGAMLKAAERKMVILVDGFIMTTCVLAASKCYPALLDYCIFGHVGDEAGHKLLLDYLHARPVLNLGLRLGEGFGALCAYPIVESAVRMINEMNSFGNIRVTKYFT